MKNGSRPSLGKTDNDGKRCLVAGRGGWESIPELAFSTKGAASREEARRVGESKQNGMTVVVVTKIGDPERTTVLMTVRESAEVRRLLSFRRSSYRRLEKIGKVTLEGAEMWEWGVMTIGRKWESEEQPYPSERVRSELESTAGKGWWPTETWLFPSPIYKICPLARTAYVKGLLLSQHSLSSLFFVPFWAWASL